VSSNLTIAGNSIKPGTNTVLQVQLPALYTSTPLSMPVHVIRGRQVGPRLFVSAAIHGDELNGLEIIRRLIKRVSARKISGTIIAIPVVNIYGMIQHTRYLPDRRDLNRSFPGSSTGSLASRLANLLMTEIVSKCTHGIDLHTAATNRDNLPQIRADLEDKDTVDLAKAFGVPVIINSKMRDGSLREAARAIDINMLLYEAGEAMRLNENCIRAGVNGVLSVMRHLKMLPEFSSRQINKAKPYIARSSQWVRAPTSGIFRSKVRLGKEAKKQQKIGIIEDVSGCGQIRHVCAPDEGIIIGKSHLPLVHEGDPLFHIAYFKEVNKVVDSLEEFEADQAL